jgi:hypothetical protein
MRGPHRHQHDAAARLLIRLNTVHPWSLRFGPVSRQLLPAGAPKTSKPASQEGWDRSVEPSPT